MASQVGELDFDDKQAGAELGQAHIIVKVEFGYRMKRLSLFFDKDKTRNG